MEYYPRTIEGKLHKWMKRDEIIFIKGPRQAGKTTLIKHMQERTDDSVYITLEDPDLRQSFIDDVNAFMKRYKQQVIFIDEIQYIQDIGQKLKFIYDVLKKKVIATGSGSFDIKGEIGKHLVGRAIYFELLPLSFEEFIMWKSPDLHEVFVKNKQQLHTFMEQTKSDYPKPVFTSEFTDLLQQYLTYGGYPAIVKEEETNIKIELLKSMRQTYLEKEVFFFFGGKDLIKFARLMELTSATIGKQLNIAKLSRIIPADVRTVSSYIDALQHTYVIQLVRPFFRNLRTELKKEPKLYFLDFGLRNSLLQDFSPALRRVDVGAMLENFIHNELARDFSLRYWRTTGKSEVDFVIIKENMLVPIEVKTQDVKITRSLHSFVSEYKPKTTVLFTLGKTGEERVRSTVIRLYPHYYV